MLSNGLEVHWLFTLSLLQHDDASNDRVLSSQGVEARTTMEHRNGPKSCSRHLQPPRGIWPMKFFYYDSLRQDEASSQYIKAKGSPANWR